MRIDLIIKEINIRVARHTKLAAAAHHDTDYLVHLSAANILRDVIVLIESCRTEDSETETT